MNHPHHLEVPSATSFLHHNRDPEEAAAFEQKFRVAVQIERLLDAIQRGRPINARPIEVLRNIGNTTSRLLQVVSPKSVTDAYPVMRKRGNTHHFITASKQGWLIEGLGVRPAHTVNLKGPRATDGLSVTMPEKPVGGAVTTDGRAYTIMTNPAESGAIGVMSTDLLQPFEVAFPSESLLYPVPRIDTAVLTERLEAIAEYSIE